MSFDPYGGYTPDKPPEDKPPQPAPDRGEMFERRPAEPAAPAPAASQAREKALLPGVFLIVVGVLNLLGAGASGFFGLAASQVSDEMFEAQAKQDPAQAARLKQVRDAGYTYQDLRNMYFYGGVVGGGVVLLLALLTIVGGVCMIRLRGYAMSVLGSLIAAVPCLSPMSCPCIFGMVVGVWALAVLLNNDVRSAFGGPG